MLVTFFEALSVHIVPKLNNDWKINNKEKTKLLPTMMKSKLSTFLTKINY